MAALIVQHKSSPESMPTFLMYDRMLAYFKLQRLSMTKADFINTLSVKLNMTKVEADNAFMAVFDTMIEVLVGQDKMIVPGFGTFSTKVREERTGRNPSTGKEMTIPRSVVANFKSAPQLKEKLNKK